jgi:pimeloyl-ACP methyl ester carboxylesterase
MICVTAVLATLPIAASAAIAWKPCHGSNEMACATLTVPLDPSGATPGTISLAMRRHRAPVGESSDAVIALAGGPGQAAVPFLGQFARVLGPVASTRDLIAFDQRGTGMSHPLSCAAFEHLNGGGGASPGAVSTCAEQIGSTRGLYTTADTVADIEAVRQAGGYEKLVLYGTSYGTKVAERYAQEYPTHVEVLVLDSVVPPNGPEAFDRTTFAAVPRVLRQLCVAHACAHITPEPVSDLARLVRRMAGRTLSGRLVEENGKPQTTHFASQDLIAVLMEGDFNPILRAEFPAAVRAAVQGDTAALARLLARAEGGEGEESLSEGFDAPLYYSTLCDESAFPWNPSVNTAKRAKEALAALRALGSHAFAPFTASDALSISDIPACAAWPHTSGGPEVVTVPLPDVPTLILSGADDLRTPTANARQVASQIPDANLLVAPDTGHSVLGSDPTPCAHNALLAQFEGRPVRRCKTVKPPVFWLPTPLSPRDIAQVAPAAGNHGLPGRTVKATALTLADFARQILLAALENPLEALLGGSPVRTGGLRAGWGEFSHDSFTLHSYSYVPGVSVSGILSLTGTGTLHVGGSAAAGGTLAVGAHGSLTGILGGGHVHIASHKHKTAVAPEGLSSLAPSRIGTLLAAPRRLASLRTLGTVAVLRYAFDAGD